MPPNTLPQDEPWAATRVVKTLWPGQAGTIKLHGHFGAQLVCVRYRHDALGVHRYTTVELVIDHAPVRRAHPHPAVVDVQS